MSEPAITSVHNERIKAFAALHRRKVRDAEGRYLVEGVNGVDEVLAAGQVEELLATEELAERYADRQVPLTIVAEHVLARVADARTPAGIIAVARRVPATLDDVLGHGFLVVLHEVADPGNAGTIIRTADAAGAAGVVLTAGSVDPWNPKTVRATVGSLTHVPIVVGVTVEEVLAACHAAGQRVVGLDARGSVDVADPEVATPPVALLFGSEAHGLPAAVRERLDLVVSVPRFGRAESLNLSAAVAVATFAVARRIHGSQG